jgi:4-diphosphocytidyl-2-C-methyl-D-erythritol kinase
MSSVMPAPVVLAPAKLTCSLRVTGRRPDGYHEIDAEMLTLDLVDELTFTDGDHLEVVGSSGLAVPEGDDNLVRRALTVLGRKAAVRLVKRIPAGAGLGGGSADAAAVLRWGGCTDLAVAVSLGADVPFCLVGGRARVSGIGEHIVALAPVERTYTLLIPPFGVATAEVYRAWDDLGGPTGAGANDLEAAALHVAPELAAWRDRLGDATGISPVLAGSGSTWFVVGNHPGDGRIVVRTACTAANTAASADR